jgi:glycine betaine/proline transport system permease protein
LPGAQRVKPLQCLGHGLGPDVAVVHPDTLLFRVTSWFGDHIVQYGLVPFRNFLVETPWPVTLVGIALVALVVSGRRAAVTTFAMLVVIGVIGEWASAMDTASQVLVATVLTVAIGFGLGVWAAESRTFSRILRPVNDVLQTLPQLVYLIPLIYLMPVSVVPGVIAGVLYAFPVVARLVENGVRSFRGIPYAAPPVGNLRWRPPQPPPMFERPIDASKFGPENTRRFSLNASSRA